MSFKRQYILLILLSLVVLPLFHNCTEFAAKSESLNTSACSTNMWPLFTDTYHNFFTVNNCKNCHAPGGLSGIPHFADPNTKKAVDVFVNRFGITQGPDIIENKLRSGHQGYSFSNFQTTLNQYKETWNEEVQSSLCTGRATTTYVQNVDFFESKVGFPNFYVVKPTMVDWQTVKWDMGAIKSNLSGVEVSVEIKVFSNEFGDPENYFVNNIKIKNPDFPVRIRKAYVLLNRQTYFVTTFSGIDTTLTASSTFQDINPGSSAGMFVKDVGDIYGPQDRWSVQFELIEPVTD